MVAFGNTISSWVSVEDLHCNPEARYVNICRAQGFFIVFGSHVIISTYGTCEHTHTHTTDGVSGGW